MYKQIRLKYKKNVIKVQSNKMQIEYRIMRLNYTRDIYDWSLFSIVTNSIL